MKLLELRRAMKSRQPEFLRQDSHKRIGPRKGWRRPKGIQSKMRLNKRGYCRNVRVGWRGPVSVRHLDRSGLQPVNVSNEQDLQTLNKEKQGMILAAGVGTRNAILLIQKALEKGIKLLNIKDGNTFVANAKKDLEKRQAEQKEKLSTRQGKKKKKETKKEKKKPEEASKEEQKKEQDKLLIKKEK